MHRWLVTRSAWSVVPMGWIWILSLLALTGLPVRITPVSGEPYRAELQNVTADGVQVAVDGNEQTVPFSELSRIDRREPSAIPEPSIGVGLADGSRLRVEGVAIEGSSATLTLRQQEPLTVPVKQLQWIRFRPPSPAVDDAWLGLLGDPQANDILVIRREGDALDQVSGIVLGVDATNVRFDLGNRELPAPINRLEGIIFGGTGRPAETAIRVVDTSGSQWAVASLESSGDGKSLELELPSGVRRTLPWEQVESLHFAGNLQLLAAEQPVESRYDPLIELPVAAEKLAAWLGPRADGQRDLVLRSRSSVTYRVDPKHSTFATRIAPDGSVAAGSGCTVRVLADGQPAWSETVLPADAPRGVELNLNGVRRVTLEVDYGEGEARSDAGDVIRFIEPRLLQ